MYKNLQQVIVFAAGPSPAAGHTFAAYPTLAEGPAFAAVQAWQQV